MSPPDPYWTPHPPHLNLLNPDFRTPTDLCLHYPRREPALRPQVPWKRPPLTPLPFLTTVLTLTYPCEHGHRAPSSDPTHPTCALPKPVTSQWLRLGLGLGLGVQLGVRWEAWVEVGVDFFACRPLTPNCQPSKASTHTSLRDLHPRPSVGPPFPSPPTRYPTYPPSHLLYPYPRPLQLPSWQERTGAAEPAAGGGRGTGREGGGAPGPEADQRHPECPNPGHDEGGRAEGGGPGGLPPLATGLGGQVGARGWVQDWVVRSGVWAGDSV